MASETRTVKVASLRIIPPSDPAKFLFVAKWVINGKVKSKSFTRAMVAAGASANIAAGTLTLPTGKRGRRVTVGMSQESLNALLAGVRSA